MRSSPSRAAVRSAGAVFREYGRLARLAFVIAAGTGLLSGCARPPGDAPAGTTAVAAKPGAAPVRCVAAAGSGATDAQALATLRASVEQLPLYTAMAGKAALGSCRVVGDGTRTTLAYTFGDGSTLHVSRDTSIEYSSQEAHFASALTDDPVALLTRAEHGSFGAEGCGIDWQSDEREPAIDDAKATEQVYRGEVCNCQARVRRDSAGTVVGLVMRSTC